MTLLELMQMSGDDDLGIVKADLKRAFIELESMYPEKIEQAYTTILANQRFYNLPDKAIQIEDIRIKYEEDGETKYRSIPRIKNVTEVEEDGI